MKYEFQLIGEVPAVVSGDKAAGFLSNDTALDAIRLLNDEALKESELKWKPLELFKDFKKSQKPV